MKRDLSVLMTISRIFGGDPRFQNWLSKFMQYFSRVCAVVVNVCFIMELCLNWQGVKTLAKLNIYPSIVIFHVKLLTLQNRSNELLHISELTENLYINDQLPEGTKCKIKKALTLARVFIITFYAVGFLASAIFLLAPFFSEDKTLVFTAHSFCDIHTSPCFEINYAWNVINQIMLYSTVITYDCLFIYFIAEVWCAVEVTRGMLDTFETGTFARQHDTVLKYVKELNRFYSTFLLLQTWFSLEGLILGVYMMTSEGIPPPSNLLVKYGILIIILVVQLFIYCYGGAIVMHQTQSIANDVFLTVDWSSKTYPVLRKNLSFIILRAQRVEKLSVGKMMDLNLECFVNVLKNTMSVYTLLLTMEKKAIMAHEAEQSFNT